MAIDTTYQLRPGESIDAYNKRIAAYNASKGSTPSPVVASTTGIDTTYQLRPGESISAYNERIRQYNASKAPPKETKTTTKTTESKPPPPPPTYQAPTSAIPQLKLPQAPQLPQQGDLVQFSNALASATELARQNRNAQGLSVVSQNFAPGMLNASDFSSILGNLNKAGDRTLETSLDIYNTAQKNQYNSIIDQYNIQRQQAIDTYNASVDRYNSERQASLDKYNAKVDAYNANNKALTSDISVYTDNTGKLTGVNVLTGEVVWEQPGLGKGSESGLTSGGLTLSAQDIADFYTALQTGSTAEGTKFGNPRGADGFVDPRVWLQLYDTWRSENGLTDDFLDKFPIENINPANTWIKAELSTRGLGDEWDKYVGSGSSGSAGWTPTEVKKLEAAGLLYAPREQQLAFLYPQKATSGTDVLIDKYLSNP